jgi:hypothetical protein
LVSSYLKGLNELDVNSVTERKNLFRECMCQEGICTEIPTGWRLKGSEAFSSQVASTSTIPAPSLKADFAFFSSKGGMCPTF